MHLHRHSHRPALPLHRFVGIGGCGMDGTLGTQHQGARVLANGRCHRQHRACADSHLPVLHPYAHRRCLDGQFPHFPKRHCLFSLALRSLHRCRRLAIVAVIVQEGHNSLQHESAYADVVGAGQSGRDDWTCPADQPFVLRQLQLQGRTAHLPCHRRESFR